MIILAQWYGSLYIMNALQRVHFPSVDFYWKQNICISLDSRIIKLKFKISPVTNFTNSHILRVPLISKMCFEVC